MGKVEITEKRVTKPDGEIVVTRYLPNGEVLSTETAYWLTSEELAARFPTPHKDDAHD